LPAILANSMALKRTVPRMDAGQTSSAIVPQLLKHQTPVMVELASDGAAKKGRVVLAIPLLENFSWLLGVEFDSPGNFWGVDNPPEDWCS
jgi:hypothetical protein